MLKPFAYPAILTCHDDHTVVYFPDLHLTGCVDIEDQLEVEAREILAGYLEVLEMNNEQLPPATDIKNISSQLKPNQKIVVISNFTKMAEAIDYAIRNNAQEGLELTPDTLALFEKVKIGKLTLDELGQIIDAKAKALANKPSTKEL